MMRPSCGWRRLILVILAIALCRSSAARADEPLRTAGDRPVDIKHIKLDLDVSLKEKRIAGTATIDLQILRPLRVLRLDAVRHEVSGVYLADPNKSLDFENTGKELQIDLGEKLSRGEQRRVVIHYQIREPKIGLHFFGPTAAEPDVPWMVWSQGEAITNRHWFPCLDHPNERQTTEVIATVESGFEVLSNGVLLSRKKTADGSKVRFHWRQSQPHVAYLVTLVVGKFTIGREKWGDVPVLYYVPPGRAQDMQRTFGRTREMMTFFSERFGIAYPWEKYAQVVVEQFVVGGMENTGATTLHQRVMHDERAMLDSSPDRLIAHELGHQWWGDLITCRDWTHLWLNEGFATYCEVLWTEFKLGHDERDYLLYKKSESARSSGPKTRPIVDRRYPNPSSMFDARAYPKGGWVLHMLRHRLGTEQFFAGLQAYGNRYRFQTVETSDLRKVFEEQTGRSLERFFYDWTARKGHPELEIATTYDPEEKLVKIAVKQTQKSDAFHFPLRIELRCEETSQPVVVQTDVTEKEFVLYRKVPARPDLVRVDPEFSVLADIKEKKSQDLWKMQILEAPTVAERLRAIRHFSSSKSTADRELLQQVLQSDPFFGVRIKAAAALGKSGGDLARDALIEGLNQNHPKVRKACADALAKFHDDDAVITALKNRLATGDASYFVEASLASAFAKVHSEPPIGPLQQLLKKDSHGEVIRKAALRGLGYSTKPETHDLLLDWTGRGKPRACRIAAIRALATYLSRNAVKKQKTTKTIELLTGYLKQDGPRVRRAVIETLRDLGSTASPARAILTTLSEQDPDGRVRNLAKAALPKLDAGTPAPEEISKLRTELGKLRRTNRTLEERLQKLESK